MARTNGSRARHVAITGAAGFLGQHLARGFEARGAVVLPIVRGPAPVTMDGVLAEPAQLAGTDVLVHAAAIRHRHGVDAQSYRASNVELVERLMRACAGRVSRFVYVSSVGVYGFPRELPITEAHPAHPVTLYSVTKVEAEQRVRRVAAELGLEAVIVRPTIIYGPGDRAGMLDKMATMIRAGTYRVVGDGQNTLHHTHVDDIVEGLWRASTVPGAAGEDFILCGPETITLQRLSERVAEAVSRPLPRLHVPLAVARAVATAVGVLEYRGLAFADREPPINHEKLDVMTVSIAFDCTKARRLLGYAPRVGYEEGVARTLGGTPR